VVTTDLITAARSGSIAAVEQVLQQLGLEQSTANNAGYTSAVTAIYGGSATLTDVIISRTNTDLNAQGVTGNTMMMWASLWGQLNVVKSLLQQGADLTLKNNDGLTALQLASNGGYRDIVNLLRNSGAV